MKLAERAILAIGIEGLFCNMCWDRCWNYGKRSVIELIAIVVTAFGILILQKIVICSQQSKAGDQVGIIIIVIAAYGVLIFVIRGFEVKIVRSVQQLAELDFPGSSPVQHGVNHQMYDVRAAAKSSLFMLEKVTRTKCLNCGVIISGVIQCKITDSAKTWCCGHY
jgi:uncharacterized protein with PQ loop repeat